MKSWIISVLFYCIASILAQDVDPTEPPSSVDTETEEFEFLPTDTPLLAPRAGSEVNNQHPVIGVLAHEYKPRDPHQVSNLTNKTDKKVLHIQSIYIKFVEAGGARAVPILAWGDKTYLRMMFNSINGLVLPGGVVSLRRSLYAKAGKFLLKLATEANDNGVHFPVWGECLGMQFILAIGSGSKKNGRTKCPSSWNVSQPVEFTEEGKQSKLYGGANRIRSILATKPVSVHFHTLCVLESTFNKLGFSKYFKILSRNTDMDTGNIFVSSTESIKYPFYALGFHPESIYEWLDGYSIVHTSDAVEVEQYFARFFVNEARRNNHAFETRELEDKYVMDNFPTERRGFYYFFRET